LLLGDVVVVHARKFKIQGLNLEKKRGGGFAWRADRAPFKR